MRTPFANSAPAATSSQERAELACRALRCEEAIAALEEAVWRQPGDFRPYYQLGLCCGGGCRVHSMTSPEMAAAYLRRASAMAAAAAPITRAAILDALASALSHCREVPREVALRDSIACHEQAAEMYASLSVPGDWARTQFNLGNAYCELAEVTGEDHWRNAVAHYEAALQVRTRQADPERWAALMENLGTAYRHLPGGGHVKHAISCYRCALHICSPAAYPARNAGLHNNIANALLSLPETAGDCARITCRALHHFECALRIQSADRASRDYGITQFNRAQAYMRLARSAEPVNLDRAARCAEDARAAFQACGDERLAHLADGQLDRIRRMSAKNHAAG